MGPMQTSSEEVQSNLSIHVKSIEAEGPLKFNVPYYAQSSDFSCGPACVLMVMKHFNPNLHLTRALEYEVWRQCNMIGIRGADPYGLSVPLIDAGYDVRLMTQWSKVTDPALWKRRLVRHHFTAEEARLGAFGIAENKKRALSRNLRVEHKRPTVDHIVDCVRKGFVPIALVHMGVVHRLNIPHWVVVTDADEDKVVFNDPYPPKGQRGLKLNHGKFQRILDDIGTRIGMSPSTLFVRNT